MHRFILACVLFLGMMTTSAYGQELSCDSDSDEPALLTVGLVFPSGTLITPNRIDYYEGAIGMIDTLNRCGDEGSVRVDWVHAFAEDYEQAVDVVHELVAEHDVKLIIGGGSSAVSTGLADAVRELDIILWETSEGQPTDGQNTFSPTSSDFQRGLTVGEFIRSTYGEDAKVALIYNEREQASNVARGIRNQLDDQIAIEEHYEAYLSTREIAGDIRQQNIDVVVLVAFQVDADYLWRAMRQADANVRGWINVGDPGYRYGLCRRIGDTDGLITIHRFAVTNPEHAIFHEFARYYQTEFGRYPGERAHLSASGVYMLMRYVLPLLESEATAEAIRQAIYQATADIGDGMMGEGLQIDAENGSNTRASLVVQQNQSGLFCTVAPSALATCDSVTMFPSWRDRAIIQDEQGCMEPWAVPDL